MLKWSWRTEHYDLNFPQNYCKWEDKSSSLETKPNVFQFFDWKRWMKHEAKIFGPGVTEFKTEHEVFQKALNYLG